MKKRHFADGGQTFSPEQEKWLGGADRTDPYILARMRRAVPDSPQTVDNSYNNLETKRLSPSKSVETSDINYDNLETKRLPKPSSVETSDSSYDNLETKRFAPFENKVNKPEEDAMAVAASKVKRAPVAKTTMQRARLDVPNATGPRSASNPMNKDPLQQSSSKNIEPSSVDETKLSLSDRIKLSRERAKTSSTGTDTRPVNQRIRSMFGMKKGGTVKGYASGGSVSSRADGIAQRGKTRGRMC